MPPLGELLRLQEPPLQPHPPLRLLDEIAAGFLEAIPHPIQLVPDVLQLSDGGGALDAVAQVAPAQGSHRLHEPGQGGREMPLHEPGQEQRHRQNQRQGVQREPLPRSQQLGLHGGQGLNHLQHTAYDIVLVHQGAQDHDRLLTQHAPPKRSGVSTCEHRPDLGGSRRLGLHEWRRNLLRYAEGVVDHDPVDVRVAVDPADHLLDAAGLALTRGALQRQPQRGGVRARLTLGLGNHHGFPLHERLAGVADHDDHDGGHEREQEPCAQLHGEDPPAIRSSARDAPAGSGWTSTLDRVTMLRAPAGRA